MQKTLDIQGVPEKFTTRNVHFTGFRADLVKNAKKTDSYMELKIEFYRGSTLNQHNYKCH